MNARQAAGLDTIKITADRFTHIGTTDYGQKVRLDMNCGSMRWVDAKTWKPLPRASRVRIIWTEAE